MRKQREWFPNPALDRAQAAFRKVEREIARQRDALRQLEFDFAPEDHRAVPLEKPAEDPECPF